MSEESRMKKTIIRIAVCVVVFLASALIIGSIMNQGHNNMTMEMAPATLPMITMESGGVACNELHGNTVEMDVAYQKDCITLLGEGRQANFTVDTFGREITGISTEVRSIDGSRLIENSEVTGWKANGKSFSVSLTLKDLIDTNTQYSLTLILELEGEHAREDGKPVGTDKVIVHALAPVQGRVHAEQHLQGIRLHDRFALETGPGGDVQPFRVERGQLPGPAVPAECPHISAQGLQAFLAQAVRIGIIHHVLQVLLCQVGNALLPDRGQNARAPTAFNIAAVAGAVRLFQCGIPVFIQLIHPAGLDAYPIIQPGICLCVRFPLACAARL